MWDEVIAWIALPIERFNINELFGSISVKALATIGVLILAVAFLFFGLRWLAKRTSSSGARTVRYCGVKYYSTLQKRLAASR